LDIKIWDKLLHFSMFLIMTVLAFFVTITTTIAEKETNFVAVAGIMVIASVCSELIQAFVPWRTFESGDIVANLFGTTTGLGIAAIVDWLLTRRQEQYRNKYMHLVDADDWNADAESDSSV